MLPYIVSDDRGLYVEVLPSGSIVWRYRYRLDGKRENFTLGKYPALTLNNTRLKRDEAAQKKPPWPTSPSDSSRTSSHATART